jgi:hypothetical protein
LGQRHVRYRQIPSTTDELYGRTLVPTLFYPLPLPAAW